jgi:hypothetical protein
MILRLVTSKFYRVTYLAGSLLMPAGLHAQSSCMLVPVELTQRVHGAPLVVEARVTSQQTERLPSGRHLVTRSQLDVYKVFKGQLPAGTLSVLAVGGTLGQEREEATGTLMLQPGEQGVFFLEPDPAAPGEWRAYAGPQGLLRYDLLDLSASDPFGHYDAIGADVQSRVATLAGVPYHELRANQLLQQAVARQAARQVALLGTPSISGFSPASVVAGANNASSLLTISGSGFGSTKGTVQFRNADSPGTTAAPTYTTALDSDVLQWSDTQVQVRVPSRSASGNAAGTGLVRVVDAASSVATSTGPLTVTYALSNVAYTNTVLQTYRVHLLGSTNGGYALAYSTSFPEEAKTAFSTALQSWRCATGMNRLLTTNTTTVDATSNDNLNVVRFGGASELPTGVLGVTNSYYNGCGASATSITNWVLVDTDYTFAPVPYPGYTWNFASEAPTGTQFDFQSVVLHELGHGQQLTHIISATGVMNYSVSNGQVKRTLDASTDIAGGTDVISYTLNAPVAESCGRATFAKVSSCPLPVELVAFTATAVPGQGAQLSWSTASERTSAAFVVESQDEATAASAWHDLARVVAAGTSTSAHTYGALDPHLLAGTRYYRLRQIDLDGTTAYSPVVAVRATEAATVVAYPNPAATTATLRGPLASGEAAAVRLLDATGRCVARLTGPVGQATFGLPLAGVPAGLYLIEWTAGTTRCHTRLVVE